MHERALSVELKSTVTELATKIGERNADKKWELASAADMLANALEDAGYKVDREGYEVGEIVAQNIEVTLPGGARGDETVIVGAHYDTASGSPGADDNASGAAAVIALARAMRDARPARNLHFVLFPNEEAPFFKTKDMGSLRYAKGAAARGDKVVAMISIESIGYFSDAAGSQHLPEGLEGRYPTTGDFVAFVSRKSDEKLVGRALATFLAHATLPAQGASLDESTPGVGDSDHWAFWQMGWPALMVTDTAPYRNPDYHKPGDTPDKLDFERMARTVAGLEGVIADLAGMTGT